MPVVVKHKKVSEVPDSADETIIQPSDWNEEHEISGAVSLEELNARLQDFSAENPADYNGVGFSYGMTSNGTVWNPGAFRVAKYTGTGIPLMNVLQMTDTGGRLSSGDPVNDFNTVNKRSAVLKVGDINLGGFTSAGYNLGNLAGTITPNPANGNFQYGSKNGATTLNAPPNGYYSLQIEMVNTASPGGLTIVGALVKGEFNPEAGKKHFVTFRVSGSTKVANIEEAN